jgi:hypothetical protein
MPLPLFRTQQPVNLFQVISKCNSVDSTSSTIDVNTGVTAIMPKSSSSNSNMNNNSYNNNIMPTTTKTTMTRTPSPGSSSSSSSSSSHNSRRRSSTYAHSETATLSWRTKEPSSIFAAPSRQISMEDDDRCNAFDEDDNDSADCSEDEGC